MAPGKRSASPAPGAPLQLLRWRGRTQVFVERIDGLALPMVRIPAGTFWMGSPDGEEGRSKSEGPMRQVRLGEFLMSQTPITQAQWREVAAWKEREGEKWERELRANPSYFVATKGQARLFKDEASTDGRPVEQVSWEDAMEFCSRLSQRTGRTYTLPSEAQWEYACRAGTTTPFAFGETLTDELANYDARITYGKVPKGAYREQTTPVGMFPANGWGLQDMHGNVWEWCLDQWHGNYEGAPEDGSAWLTDGDGKAEQRAIEGMEDERGPDGKERAGGGGRRLLRGGSWLDDPWNCRSANRNLNQPVNADYTVGFRVVCLPQDPSLNA